MNIIFNINGKIFKLSCGGLMEVICYLLQSCIFKYLMLMQKPDRVLGITLLKY